MRFLERVLVLVGDLDFFLGVSVGVCERTVAGRGGRSRHVEWAWKPEGGIFTRAVESAVLTFDAVLPARRVLVLDAEPAAARVLDAVAVPVGVDEIEGEAVLDTDADDEPVADTDADADDVAVPVWERVPDEETVPVRV